MQRNGTVLAVCLSSKGNVPKYPQEQVEVYQYGIVGDFHAGEMRISRRSGLSRPNERQVSLFSNEARNELNEILGTSLVPGSFGENITTDGLGDLSDIPNGALVRIGDSLVLEVMEQNDPCSNLNVYHPLMVKQSYGRRGLLAIVKEGAPILVRPGDTIQVL